MKILNKPRGSGKTVQLIYTSEATGIPIVTAYGTDSILALAKKHGCDIPRPYTLSEWQEIAQRSREYEDILVDELEPIIRVALDHYLKANIVCGTITLPEVHVGTE